MCRKIRKRHQAVRNCYDPVCIISIYHRIGQYSAICLSTDTTTVSIIITRRCSDKCNIQVYFSCFDCPNSAAVRAHHCKPFQFSLRNRLSNLTAHTGRLDSRNRSIFHVRHQSCMRFPKRAGTNGNIFNTHFMDFFHHHIYNQITIPEMMMKSNCHAIPDFTFYQCLMNCFHQFTAIGIHHTAGFRTIFPIFITIIIMHSVKYFFSCYLQYFLGNFSPYCIFHFTVPPRTHRKPWPVQWFALRHHKTQYQSSFHLQ